MTPMTDNADFLLGKIFVFFDGEPKFGIGTINIYTNRMKSKKVFRSILVVQKNLTPYALKFIDEISSKFHLEVFQESELLANITENVLVPEHKVLSNLEKKTFLEGYTVEETQLPRIQVTDPFARYFGMARGQIVKITR